jgi:hypothetical protein
LLRVNGEFLHVTAPEADFDQMVIYGFGVCNFATWVE